MRYTIPPKKMLILNILDILKRYSDQDHRLSAKEIGEKLEREYAQKADRKAIKRNLMNLIDFGYELEYTETIRKNQRGEEETITSDWYLVRDFTDAELRLLIDGLLFSKTVPYNQCKAMIHKLEALSNNYFKAKVKHIRGLPEKYPENKQLFWTIDVLDEAISSGRQVSFHYIDYGIDKKPYPRTKRDGGGPEQYSVSPYQMAATNGRYYLICNRTGFSRVSNYRVDRIKDIQILDAPIVPLRTLSGYENGLDLPRHMAEHIYMFAGEAVPVTFYADSGLIGNIMDWFGSDVRLSGVNEGTVRVDVTVNENAMFFWALQYGMGVEVIAPASLRARLVDAARTLMEKYAAPMEAE